MTTPDNESLIIVDMVINSFLFALIFTISVGMLYRVKIKLNIETKFIYYLNLLALALRIAFTVW